MSGDSTGLRKCNDNDSNKIIPAPDDNHDNYVTDNASTPSVTPSRGARLRQEEVRRAVEELEEAGIDAGPVAVRKRLGRGSLTTITSMLATIREEREAERLERARHHIDETEVRNLASQLVERAFMGNMKQIEYEREVMRREHMAFTGQCRAEVMEMARRVDSLEEELASLREAERSRALHEAGLTRRLLAKADESMALREENVRLRQRIKSLRMERKLAGKAKEESAADKS